MQNRQVGSKISKNSPKSQHPKTTEKQCPVNPKHASDVIVEAVRGAENTLDEFRLFADALRAAMRTWNDEGEPTKETMDKRELGIMLLNNRLIDALESHLATIRADCELRV